MSDGLKLLLSTVVSAFVAGVAVVLFLDERIDGRIEAHLSAAPHSTPPAIDAPVTAAIDAHLKNAPHAPPAPPVIIPVTKIDRTNCKTLTPVGSLDATVSCDAGFVMTGYREGRGHSGDNSDIHTYECCALISK